MTTEIDGLFICPYNQSHMVDGLKLPNHLVKCRKNNPDLAKKLQICPYNQCHHVPKEDMKNHLTTCKEYHTLQSQSIKPCGESLSHGRGQTSAMEEEFNLGCNPQRYQFQQTKSTGDPVLDAEQNQKNQDDLDEWFAE